MGLARELHRPALPATRGRAAARRTKVLILGATATSLVRFRGALIDELVREGCDVVCAAPAAGQDIARDLARRGARFLPVTLSRNGMNPLGDLATITSLTRLMRGEPPDVLLAYNIKPIVYGTLAGWLARVKRRVAMVEGLGYAYTPGRGWKRRIVRLVSDVLYRIPCALADAMIVLNRDDRAFFAGRFMRGREDRLHLVPGIGVDLAEFAPAPLPDGPTTFVMISRLLRDKGVYEFVEAARRVKRERPDTRFLLVGGADENPTSVKPAEVEAWVEEGVVDYAGEVADVRPWLRQAHVFVLPSYREGMPRTVMEAMAMGRPCIVTDVPGCREAVEHESTGLLVAPQSTDALADACVALCEPTKRERLANAAAAYARRHFNEATLAHQTAERLISTLR